MTGWFDRASGLLLRWFHQMQRTDRSPVVERSLAVIAGMTFVALTVAALTRLPSLPQPNWLALAAAAAMVLVTLSVNSWEYTVISRALGGQPDRGHAFRTTVLASFANLLPVPGAVLVKVRGLSHEGKRVREGLPVVVAAGGTWVAVSLCLGAGLLSPRDPRTGAALAVVGLAALGISSALIRRSPVRRPWLTLARIGGVEGFSVCATALRLYLLLWGLSGRPAALQAVALATAAIIASAIGLVPSGLGIREVLSAGAAAMVDLDPAVGLLVSALDRVALAGVTGLVALAMGAGRSVGRRRPHNDPASPTVLEQDGSPT